jgi:membrane-associated phospholipid phosphatase
MRLGPLLVTFLTGAALIALYFIPNTHAQAVNAKLLEWATIVYAFALILGSVSLWNTHARKVKLRMEGWPFSIVTLVSLVGVTALGVWKGVDEKSPVGVIYTSVNSPLASTMFALLAFFIASAAFRAFRARNVEATLLLVTAIVMMIGRVSIGEFMWRGFPPLTEWLLDVPNLAAKRSVAIGVGLGAISTALKIILGIERSYLGSRS